MQRRAVMTTSWDDGHPLDKRLAGMLTAHGLSGTFYIPRKAENVTMEPAEIREISRSFEIGAHTMRHTFLDSATDLVAEREITESRAWIQDVTGKPCMMFCPPGGRFDRTHLKLIEAAGYTGIRTVEGMSLAVPRRIGGLLVLPTTIQSHPQPRKSHLKNAIKRRSATNLWNYVSNGCGTDWVRMAERLLTRVLRHGGVFHLWGHSWEIEQYGQWSNLGRILAVMGRHLGDIPCVTNWQLCTGRDIVQSVGPAVRVMP